MNNLSIFIAFISGLLSFLSPCVLPLIPSYIIYLAGISLKELEGGEKRVHVIINSLFFIAGFSLIFILLGATASLLGQLLYQFRGIIRIAGGIVVAAFGFYIMGILKLPFLELERRFHFKTKPAGYLGSFLVGVAFAAAWTPCVGAYLGSILLLASTSATLNKGIVLLSFFSLGFAIPFLLTSLLIDSMLNFIEKIKKFMGALEVVSGLFLVVVGVLILTNYFSSIISFLSGF